MDPVFSAMKIIGLAATVAQQIDEYYETYKEYPVRAEKFSKSYKLKKPIIDKALEYLFYDDSLAQDNNLKELFESLEDEVKALEERLKSEPQKGFRAKWQRLRDRLSADEVNKKLAELSEYCQDLNRHISLFSMMEAVKTKNDRVIHWISDYSFDDRRQDMYRLYHKETLKWVLEKSEIKAWADDLQNGTPSKTSQRPVLWFKGKPGVGKSVMASFVASQLKDAHSREKNFCLLYFFFHFQQEDQQQAEHVLRSLARQAVQEKIMYNAQLPLPVAKIYNEYNGGNNGKISQEAAVKILEGLLPEFDRSYIIIDGLDEYHQKHDAHENVPTVLLRLAGDPTNKIRLMVTSRLSSENWAHAGKFDEIPMGASKDDMRIYLEKSIDASPSAICRKLSRDPEAKKRVVHEILDRSVNQFQLARLGFELLNKSESRTDFFESIRNISSQVYSNYGDSIQRIDSQHQHTTGTQLQEPLGIRALAFVLHAQERFTGPQLQHLLAMRLGKASLDLETLPEPEYIVQSTLGLISYTDSGHFQFSHKTVAEFLRSPDQAERFNNLQILLAQNLHAYKSFAAEKSAKDYPLIHYSNTYLTHHLLSYFYRKIYPYAEESAVQSAVDQCIDTDFEKSQQEEWLRAQWKGDLTKLHYAAIIGAEDLILPIMLDNGLSIDAQDSSGYTALHIACMWCRKAMVRALLVNQANIQARSAQGQTPLHLACKMGYRDIVAMLISRNADCNAPDGDGLTALHHAVRDSRMEIVDLLLNTPGIDIEAVDIKGNTPLIDAVDRDRYEAISWLIDNGANVNHSGEVGATALMHAAVSNNIGVGRMLIEKGSAFHLKDKNGRTALHYAAICGHVGFIELLLSHDPQTEMTDNQGRTPLFKAVESNEQEAIHCLIAAGASIKHIDNDGESMLFHSASRGWTELGALLIKLGCPVNQVCHKGKVALHHAAVTVHDDYVKMLISNGAEVNVENNEKETPMWNSVCYNRLSIVSILLAHGASMTHINRHGRSMLFNSAHHGWVEMGAFVLKHGCPINHACEKGDTALHEAALYGRDDYVKMLLDHGVDVHVENKEKETPLWYAVCYARTSTINILVAYGARMSHVSRSGNSMLFNSAHHGWVEIGKLVIAHGENIHHRDSNFETALFIACGYNRVEYAEMLIDAGAEVDVKNRKGETPLLLTCRGGRAAVAEMLIRRGADIHILDQEDKSMFHHAVEDGHLDVLKVLVNGGADVHELNGDGQSALHRAVMANRVEMAEYLLKQGLDPALADFEAQTPVDKAKTAEMRRLLKT